MAPRHADHNPTSNRSTTHLQPAGHAVLSFLAFSLFPLSDFLGHTHSYVLTISYLPSHIVQAARLSPSQIITSHSFAVDTHAGALSALDAVAAAHGGRCPDAFFLCAGAGRPGFFVEQTEESLTLQMQETYWAQAWSALVRRCVGC